MTNLHSKTLINKHRRHEKHRKPQPKSRNSNCYRQDPLMNAEIHGQKFKEAEGICRVSSSLLTPWRFQHTSKTFLKRLPFWSEAYVQSPECRQDAVTHANRERKGDRPARRRPNQAMPVTLARTDSHVAVTHRWHDATRRALISLTLTAKSRLGLIMGKHQTKANRRTKCLTTTSESDRRHTVIVERPRGYDD